ncbi:hypothetical protein [Alkalimarinus coralli]|uniref:hypothetical protein n=1 Tax=Alkalimarinus coralli TaxID=2935863 RepID=UPI00202AD602|nr:hypothetical protein [Alkalimarinus coralli]
MVNQNIILTGIPRSGTTLSCHLLNQLQNVLAMVEPMDIGGLLAQPDREARAGYINRFFSSVREDVHNKGVIVGNLVEGDTNTFNQNESGKRQPSLIKPGAVKVGANFSNDFRLIIKHPNAFSALLPELIATFSCFAIIRNPLSVLSSWNSLDHPLAKGHAPMAEAFDDELHQKLNEEVDNLERQLMLLNWYYQQYARYLNANNIIRYEDIVSSQGRALYPIAPAALELKESLVSKNSNSLYDTDFMKSVFERLIVSECHGCWQFYSKHEIAAVLDEASAG